MPAIRLVILLIFLSHSFFVTDAAAHQELEKSPTQLVAEARKVIGHGNLEEHKAVLEKLTMARKLYGSRNDQHGQIECDAYTGVTLIKLRRTHEGIEYLQKALYQSNNIQYSVYLGYILDYLGIAYSNIGEYQRGREYLSRSIKYYDEDGDRLSVGAIYMSIGICDLRLGKMQDAYNNMLLSLYHRSEVNNEEGVAYSLGNLGTLFQNAGQFRTALKYYKLSIQATPSGDMELPPRNLINIGYIYSQMGRYGDAIHYLERGVASSKNLADPEVFAFAQNNLGLAYLGLDRKEEARRHFQFAVALFDKIEAKFGKAYTLTNLASLDIKQGKYEDAIKLLNNALEMRVAIRDNRGEAITLTYRGNALSALSQRAEARADYERALQAVDKLITGTKLDDLKRSTAESYQFVFSNYIRFLTQSGNQEDNRRALEVSEQARARALKDLLTKRQSVNQVIDRETSMQAFRSYIRDKRFSKSASVDETFLQKKLTKYIQDNSLESATGLQPRNDTAAALALSSDVTTSPVLWPTIKHLCRNSTTLIYHTLDDAVIIFLVMRDGQVIAKNVPVEKGKIKRLISNTVVNFQLNNGTASENLKQLYNILIVPVEGWLPISNKNSAEPIVIIPYGEMFSIPFSALLSPTNEYLIEKYAIRTVPSFATYSLIAKRRKKRTNNINALVLGNPAMPRGWSQLPAAEREVEKISNTLKKAKIETRVATFRQATEILFRQRMNKSNIIHVASHGFYNPSNALLSGFVLAGVNGTYGSSRDDSDGIITAKELLRLEGEIDLFVLSTCDSGIGDLGADGVFGLQTAVLASGTRDMVASLWSVDDRATSRFMSKFYQAYVASMRRDVATCLRAAQLQMLKSERYASPTYWAAFYTVGAE